MVLHMPEANDVSVIIPVRCPKTSIPPGCCTGSEEQRWHSCTTGRQQLSHRLAQADTSTQADPAAMPQVYNEERGIVAALRVVQSFRPPVKEVMVVDGNSADRQALCNTSVLGARQASYTHRVRRAVSSMQR